MQLKKKLIKFGYWLYDKSDLSGNKTTQKIKYLFTKIYFLILAVILKKESFNIYQRLVLISLNLNQINKADEYYKKLSLLVTDSQQKTRSLNTLAQIYYHKNEYQKALDLYFEILDSAQYKTTILSNIAYTYEKIGNFGEALKFAEKSIEVSTQETGLAHTIDPKENVRGLIERLEDKLK